MFIKHRIPVDALHKHDTRDDIPYIFFVIRRRRSPPAALLKNVSVTKTCIHLLHILTISLLLMFRLSRRIVAPVFFSHAKIFYHTFFI